jgi:hypothetical protein
MQAQVKFADGTSIAHYLHIPVCLIVIRKFGCRLKAGPIDPSSIAVVFLSQFFDANLQKVS